MRYAYPEVCRLFAVVLSSDCAPLSFGPCRTLRSSRQLVAHTVFDARLEYLDRRKRRYIAMLPAADAHGGAVAPLKESINAKMVELGLAVVDKEVPAGYEDETAVMTSAENHANATHVCCEGGTSI